MMSGARETLLDSIPTDSIPMAMPVMAVIPKATPLKGTIMEHNIYQERLAAILSRIAADPSCWCQLMWHCDTAHCLAGHAQLDACLPRAGSTAAIDGAQWLGMSQAVADWAFHGERTIAELSTLLDFDLSSERDPDGYDRDGFDYYGVDRNGYARLVLAIGFDRSELAHNQGRKNHDNT
jgi:hypothetical protein